MALNKESDNSVFGEPANDQVPADGTGSVQSLRLGTVADYNRCYTARSMALPFQKCFAQQVCSRSEMDKDH